MNDKRCIFHYPGPIVENPSAGSQLRPKMMLDAFEKNGYNVEKIIGYGVERKAKIKEVEKKIKNGVRYDFVYSESLTQPTLLAEKDHIPRHPFIDFSFFKICKKYNIPIGLFYRDMYWKFPIYQETVPWYKRIITIPLYKYDLLMYLKLIDVMFVPSVKIEEYGLDCFKLCELPPGCQEEKEVCEYKQNIEKSGKSIHLFYVGGLGGVYNPYNVVKAVSECKDVFLTICTGKEHWDSNKSRYDNILNDNIEVVHKKSSELKTYYKNSDIALVCQAHSVYMDMASPIKAKEALGYGTPIIISSNMDLSQDVIKNNYGWRVVNSVEEIKNLLEYLKSHPEEIREKTLGAISAMTKNTWEYRANQVAMELKYEFKKHFKRT